MNTIQWLSHLLGGKERFSPKTGYQAEFGKNGPQIAVTLAFCELLTANCLEIRTQEQIHLPKRLYKLRREVDLTLLTEIEQIVAREMSNFCTFPSLREKAAKKLRRSKVLTQTDAYLAEQQKNAEHYRQVIADALEYNPMVSVC